MHQELKYILLTVALAVVVGFLVALATFALIGDAAFNLPGGSLSSGFFMSLMIVDQLNYRSTINFILFIIGGTFSGLLGFLIFLALFV
ncbi:MAG: hypothetical protein UW99_C0012G0009 [Candidatus Collierbacteria bacterium GW2011_GWC2_45_15]|uniref:Uncharacterized protein n=2 Tax=Candidatus Collieribacteriota TaxID=1752725 RepID=A0A0G1GIT7_9BACT|nr:MAG: hypothetical protein UW23_C0037G0001 [Candidatus Collierbacteria bacterium GW2011_GWA1_44_12]KKT98961.1 MAG: hypothetical protein UW99_C0012G0009 [Candidatus Collierbacteria bacterium GW2011_GWC2_45_15]